MVQPVDIR